VRIFDHPAFAAQAIDVSGAGRRMTGAPERIEAAAFAGISPLL
jgi:hypothetical protein